MKVKVKTNVNKKNVTSAIRLEMLDSIQFLFKILVTREHTFMLKGNTHSHTHTARNRDADRKQDLQNRYAYNPSCRWRWLVAACRSYGCVLFVDDYHI